MNYELLKRYMKKWLMDYIKENPMTQISDDGEAALSEYHESYLAAFKAQIQKMLSSDAETTPEQLNTVFDAMREAQKSREDEELENSLMDDDENPPLSEEEMDLYFPRFVTLNLSGESQNKRNRLQQRAAKINTDNAMKYIDMLIDDAHIAYQTSEEERELEEEYDSTCVQKGTVMSLLIAYDGKSAQNFLYDSPDNKRESAQKIFKDIMEAVDAFGEDLDDEEFVAKAETYAKALFALRQSNNVSFADFYKAADIPMNESDVELEKKWKVYSHYAFNISEIVTKRLELIANPMYKTMETEDLKRLGTALHLHKFHISLDHLGFDVTSKKEDEMSQDGKISGLFNLNRTVEDLFDCKINEKDKNNITNISDTKDRAFLSVCAQIDLWKKNNLVDLSVATVYGVESENGFVDSEEMVEQLLKKGEIVFLTKDGRTGEVKLSSDGSAIPHLNIPPKSLCFANGGRSDIVAQISELSDKLGKVNPMLLWNPTKAFTDLAKNIEDLKKTGIYAEPDTYKKLLDDAVKNAKEYLKIKATDTSKPRTDLTNSRIAFAKTVVEKFANIDKLNELSDGISPKKIENEKKTPWKIIMAETRADIEAIIPKMEEYTTDELKAIDKMKSEKKRVENLREKYIRHNNRQPKENDPRFLPKLSEKEKADYDSALNKQKDFKKNCEDKRPEMLRAYSAILSIVHYKANEQFPDYFQNVSSINAFLGEMKEKMIAAGITEEDFVKAGETSPDEVYKREMRAKKYVEIPVREEQEEKEVFEMLAMKTVIQDISEIDRENQRYYSDNQPGIDDNLKIDMVK